MSVKLSKSSSSSIGDGDSASGRPCRLQFNTSQLPFPQAAARAKPYFDSWHVYFLPTLMAWAGSQDDPFGANSHLDDTVAAIWTCAYPDLKELNDETMPIVHSMVCDFLRTCIAHW